MSVSSDRMVIKDKIIANIAKAIKAIQGYQNDSFCHGQDPDSFVLTNSDWQCHKLCENLDHALLLGLRNADRGYWRVVNEFTRKGAIKEINRIQNITTDLGRGRAWIFMALNENSLECYLKCIAENPKAIKKFYLKDALVLDSQRMTLLVTLTAGLENACFNLDCDVPYLDLNAYPPRSRSLSNNRSQDEDKISVHSMESNTSRRSASGVEVLASTPESFRVATDSDSSSVTSFDTNNGTMGRSRTGSLSVDSGCHVDAATMPRSVAVESPNGNQAVVNGYEPRFKRIETIGVNEGIEQIESGLEVIRVKSKGPKSKSKKTRRASKTIDISPVTVSDKTNAALSPSPNLEFVEASILNSFRDVFPGTHSDLDNSVTRGQKDLPCSRSPGDGEEVTVISRENVNCEHGLLEDFIDNRISSSLPREEPKIDPIQDFGSGQLDKGSMSDKCNKHVNSVVMDEEIVHMKRKVQSDSSFEENMILHGRKKCHEDGYDAIERALVYTTEDNSREDKYFVGLNEEEDFYKVRELVEPQVSPRDHSGKIQDYVDFIVGTSDEADKVEPADISTVWEMKQMQCEEEDYGLQLDNNSLLCLMLDIFSEQDEQFIKMFGTTQGHSEGELTTVFIVVSDRSVYMLHQQESDHRFMKDQEIPFKEIDFLALSVNDQVINIVCTNRRKQFWLSTGNEALTSAITSCLASAMDNCEFSIPKLTVLTDATTQKICMRKYAAKESKLEPADVSVEGYFLVHWFDPSSRSAKLESTNREGSLLFRSHDSSDGHTWKPVYVILRDGMLCVFSDEDDSKPECFVRMGGDQCVGCRRSTVGEREHCIEMILSKGSSWYFAAANHIEVSDWIQALCKAVSEGTLNGGDTWSCLPCCTVLTHQKILLCHEDVQTSFFRTLGSGNMEEVTGITVDPDVKSYCIVEFESQEASVSSEQWVLYFNSGSEMIKFTKAMAKCWEQQFQVEIPINTIEDAPLQIACQDTAQHIAKLSALK